ncbi:MAG: GNAT family N-acetyltransferase [Planctomycetota bacterium]
MGESKNGSREPDEASQVRYAARYADPFSLETDRTRLRPYRASDAVDVFPLVHRQPAVTDWICWDGPETIADLVDRYLSWCLHTPEEPVYVFMLESMTTGEIIGEGTLRFDGHPGVGDLGFWLGEAYHGRGHGRDAVDLLVRAGFEHCGARTLTAQVMEGNERSLAVLDRAGFQRHRAAEAGGCGGDSAERAIAWRARLDREAWMGGPPG